MPTDTPTPREILDAIRPLAEQATGAYLDRGRTRFRGELALRWPAIAAILERHDEVVGLLERRFPIQGGPSLPWTMIAPYESIAQRNHSQSLERLAQRGGLSPFEAVLVLESRPFRFAEMAPKQYAQHAWEANYLERLE